MSEETEVVEAEVVPDDTPGESTESAASGAALVPTVATGVLRPFAAEEVGKAMEEYQAAIGKVLDDSDWQGRPGGDQSFVKKSGWRKIAKAFGLSVTRVESGVERDPEGNPIRAWSVYRATAPNGQASDGDGYCSADESRFQNAKGRQKLENDMRATATTRAKNRAISDLVGMGEVSAEEVAPGEGATSTADPKLMPTYDGDAMAVWTVIEGLVGTDATIAVSKWIIGDNGGHLPRNVGRALAAVTRVLGPPPTPAENGAEVAAQGPDEAGLPEQPPVDADGDPVGAEDEVPF